MPRAFQHNGPAVLFVAHTGGQATMYYRPPEGRTDSMSSTSYDVDDMLRQAHGAGVPIVRFDRAEARHASRLALLGPILQPGYGHEWVGGSLSYCDVDQYLDVAEEYGVPVERPTDRGGIYVTPGFHNWREE